MESVLALLLAVRRWPTGAVEGAPPGPPDAVAGAALGVFLAGLAVGLAGVGADLPLAKRRRAENDRSGKSAQGLAP
jgi:hypothetical protein